MNYNVKPAKRTVFQAVYAIASTRPLSIYDWRAAQRYCSNVERQELIRRRIETAAHRNDAIRAIEFRE